MRDRVPEWPVDVRGRQATCCVQRIPDCSRRAPRALASRRLAARLSALLNVRSVHLDDYLVRNSLGFIDHLNYGELRRALSHRPVIVEGVCMLDVLGRVGLRPDQLVYLQGPSLARYLDASHPLVVEVRAYIERARPIDRAVIRPREIRVRAGATWQTEEPPGQLGRLSLAESFAARTAARVRRNHHAGRGRARRSRRVSWTQCPPVPDGWGGGLCCGHGLDDHADVGSFDLPRLLGSFADPPAMIDFQTIGPECYGLPATTVRRKPSELASARYQRVMRAGDLGVRPASLIPVSPCSHRRMPGEAIENGGRRVACRGWPSDQFLEVQEGPVETCPPTVYGMGGDHNPREPDWPRGTTPTPIRGTLDSP